MITTSIIFAVIWLCLAAAVLCGYQPRKIVVFGGFILAAMFNVFIALNFILK